MDTKLDDFGRDLAALTQRFLDLGAKLGEAARGLAEAGAPPSDALVEALGEGRTQFIQLRSDVLAAAGDAELASVVDPESLHDLEPILESVRQALRARALRAALEDAKQQVLFTVDRVLEIVHRDDPAFATLVGAHAKAREYRAAVEALSDPEATETRQVLEDGQSFADLLTMVEDRDGLDDDRYAQLEEIVTRTYGRSLAVAIGRGRLGFVGDIVEPPPAPAPEPATSTSNPPSASRPPSPSTPPPPSNPSRWWSRWTRQRHWRWPSRPTWPSRRRISRPRWVSRPKTPWHRSRPRRKYRRCDSPDWSWSRTAR